MKFFVMFISAGSLIGVALHQSGMWAPPAHILGVAYLLAFGVVAIAAWAVAKSIKSNGD